MDIKFDVVFIRKVERNVLRDDAEDEGQGRFEESLIIGDGYHRNSSAIQSCIRARTDNSTDNASNFKEVLLLSLQNSMHFLSTHNFYLTSTTLEFPSLHILP
jgi:hypothetical protein